MPRKKRTGQQSANWCCCIFKSFCWSSWLSLWHGIVLCCKIQAVYRRKSFCNFHCIFCNSRVYSKGWKTKSRRCLRHTVNKVPLILASQTVNSIKDGRLCDIAPTILDLLNFDKLTPWGSPIILPALRKISLMHFKKSLILLMVCILDIKLLASFYDFIVLFCSFSMQT